jgi:hypothetical protein
MPTPPVPKSAMDDPAGGLSLFSTAPAPVWMPHPSGPSRCIGAAGSTFTTDRSDTFETVEKDDCPKKCDEIVSRLLSLNAEEPSSRRPLKFRL